MVRNSDAENIRVFYTDQDKQGIDAYLVGKVLSLGQKEINDNDFIKNAQEKTKVTVRLYSNKGLRKGQILYIINERNLIVSKVEVKSIYKSISFGYLLIGYGNFRRVQKDFRVVLQKSAVKGGYAYVYKSRGDYFKNQGDTAKAIQFYEKAIAADNAYAEAHMRLGEIYLEKGIYSYAKKEYDLAYKYLWHVYDNQDKYNILEGMAKIRYILAYESNLPKGNKLRNKYILEGIKYCKEALIIYDKTAEMNFIYGYFLYNNPNPDDSNAKNQMLKVLKIEPNNIKANIILARLYYKHKNQEKAIFYAKQALIIDPSNLQAQDTYKKVNIPF